MMELPAALASLQLRDSMSPCSVDNGWGDEIASMEESKSRTVNESLAESSPRMLRKRIGVPLTTSIKKQRMSPNRSGKLTTEKEIMDHYLKVNKRWSVKQTNLETIFEEPKETSDGGLMTMSGSKFRRSILFSGRLSKAKKLKRSAKVKKNQTLKGLNKEKKKRLTIEEVKKRLAESLDAWNDLVNE